MIKFIPNSKKKPVERVRLHWGTKSDDVKVRVRVRVRVRVKEG